MEGGTGEKESGGGGNQRQSPLRDGIRAPNPSHQATRNPPSEAVTLPGVMGPRERMQGRQVPQQPSDRGPKGRCFDNKHSSLLHPVRMFTDAQPGLKRSSPLRHQILEPEGIPSQPLKGPASGVLTL